MTRLPRLIYLQYIRAAAAVSVVLYHVSFYAYQIAGIERPLQIFNGEFGYYGVVAFFVISGYLMSSLIQEASLPRFLAHRFLRIYPIYWLLAALVLSARVYAGQPHKITLALLLVPGNLQFAPLGIEWTLVYEVCYYTLTSLFCLAALRRWHMSFLLVWLTVCLVFDQFAPHLTRQSALDFHYVAVTIWNMPFLLGGLGYYALRYLTPTTVWCLAGIVLLLISKIHEQQSQNRLAPLGMTLLLLYLIQRNQDSDEPFDNEVFRTLGDYSYGLYLIHAPVAQFTLAYIKSQHPLQPRLLWWVTFGLCLTAGCVAGIVDVWLYGHLKRFADRRLRRAPSITSAPAPA